MEHPPPLAIVPHKGNLWLVNLNVDHPADPIAVLAYLAELEGAGLVPNFTAGHPDEPFTGGYLLEKI